MGIKSIRWPDGTVTVPVDRTQMLRDAVEASRNTYAVVDETNLPYVYDKLKENLLPDRKKAEEWATSNPVLPDRFMGYETDTNRMKYGDGTTAWNELPYVQAPSNITISVNEPGTDTWIELPTEDLVIGGTDPQGKNTLWVELEGE